MKLELKNIAPYLPYGLKCKYIDEDKLYTLDAVITETNQDKRLLQLFHVLENPSSCKIILRPLSDLTKEIEVNGDKFVPTDRFFNSYGGHNIDYALGSLSLDLSGARSINIIDFPLKFINMLFEWHFDVFSLIDNGLAIDKNTLQS